MEGMKELAKEVYGKPLITISNYVDATALLKELRVHVAEGNILAAVRCISAKNVKSVKTIVLKEQAAVLEAKCNGNDFQCGISKEMSRVIKL